MEGDGLGESVFAGVVIEGRLDLVSDDALCE